ncbi:hypothetical protein, partial [Streptomyces sp. NPDC102476]|uniref:hypothetical protein n=1 Tax=Streptomyces sp. NPDC102476 TaxID=3366181 RepID=UPI00381AC354
PTRAATAGRRRPVTVLRRIISDTTPSGIAAVRGSGPVVDRRRTTSGAAPAQVSAVRRNGLVGVVRWSRGAGWG